ncbi:suppressor of cytokine signaling 6-like [Centruroides sculpturatus]|uniref:suppressor of cytokine signaling 6-like n=1 Tax=Centruroides sculpturatus TaxID=218467 RepID=UPI000C6D5D53|nr:suppressor of cytokine signaling 6-like [Centruroides sculpturatus]
MMKRVRMFQMKMASGGRNKQRDSRKDGGDANGDCLSEDSDAVSKGKSKNGILKSLRWRWRRSKRVKRVDNHLQNNSHHVDDDRMLASKKFRFRPSNANGGSVVRPVNCPVVSVEARPVPEPARAVEFPRRHNGTAAVLGPRADGDDGCDYCGSGPLTARGAESDEKLFGGGETCETETGGTPALVPSSSKALAIVDCHEPPRVGSLTQELFKLSKCGWYWGPITRSEAEEKLLEQSDGAFLVRDSSDDRYLLSLSFRSFGKTLHTRIEHCNGLFSFYAQPELEGHTSIVRLIEQSMNYSQSGVFCYSRSRSPGSPSYPVRLTKPVSRFTQVRSLQYLCRFVIRQHTRFDHIQKLPLPSRIKGYLEEGHY